MRTATLALAWAVAFASAEPSTLVPLLAFSSTPYSGLNLITSNEQGTALNQLFGHDDVCSFDAVIIAAQDNLHASDLRANHPRIVDLSHAASGSVHLPYLSYSDSSLDTARALASRCDSRFVQVFPFKSVTLEPTDKYVIYMEFSDDSVDLSNQVEGFSRMFPSHLVILTGSSTLQKRQIITSSSAVIPEPTLPTPLPAQSYRLLTPPLILSLGVVFGLIVPLFYFAITALGSIKSPVSVTGYKAPSLEKKNQ